MNICDYMECVMSLIPSGWKIIIIHTPGQSGASVKLCLQWSIVEQNCGVYIYKHAALTTAQNSRRLILHVTTVVWNSGVNFTTEIWSWKYELLVWTMFRWGRISELKRTGRNDKITDTQIIICFQTVHLLDCILKYNETWNQQKTEIRNVAAETQRTTYWNSM